MADKKGIVKKANDSPEDDGLSGLLAAANNAIEEHFKLHPELEHLRYKYFFNVEEIKPEDFFDKGRLINPGDIGKPGCWLIYEAGPKLDRILDYEMQKLREGRIPSSEIPRYLPPKS